MKCESPVLKLQKLLPLFLSLVLLLASCVEDGKKQQPADVAGVWSGNYAWACSNTKSGSSSLILTLTQEGATLSGTAVYLGEVSSLAGTVSGNGVTLEITGTSVVTPNLFEGTVSNSSFGGTTLNGENCSAPSGPSGSFTLTKQAPPAGTPTHIALLGPGFISSAACSPVFTLEVRDDSNTPAALVSSSTFSLTAGGSGVFYTDRSCSMPVSSITITGGGTSKNFYFKDAVVEELTVAADDPSGNLSGTTLPVSVIGHGGTVMFDLDGTAVNHSTNVHAAVDLSIDMVVLWGYDASGNIFEFFVPPHVGTYSCSGVSMYYQTAGGAQWSGYSGFGTCSVTITTIGVLGQPITGLFSGELAAQFGGAAGARAITNGEFSVVRGLP